MSKYRYLRRKASDDFFDEKKDDAITIGPDEECECPPDCDECSEEDDACDTSEFEDETDDHTIQEESDDPSEENIDHGDDDDSFDFDIGDHLERILSLFGLGERDGFPKGISGLLSKMLSPDLMSSLPHADVALDDEDLDSADRAHGKMIMMHGHKSGDEPMHVKKKIIDFGDDEDALGEASRKVSMRLAAIKGLKTSIPKNMRVASNDLESVVTDRVEYIDLLREGFDIAHRLADAGGKVIPSQVADLVVCINPGEYRDSIPSSARRVVAEVISDLAMYGESEGFFRSAACRIKTAYRRIVDGEEPMSRVAYYEVRTAPAEEAEGYNPCPKFKSSGVEVPVEWTFCRDYCIEGKQQGDGKVECKFSSWLEDVADSHEKAMNRLDEHKNPANEDMRLRIPDGKKENPKREIDTHIETKLDKDGKRGREWDDMMPKAGLAGRHMNVEALIGEILDGSRLERHEVGNDDSTEKRLRDASSSKIKDESRESMLEDKRDDAAFKDGRSNEEALIAEVRPKKGFNIDKLLDELIQDAFPRDHDERPKG